MPSKIPDPVKNKISSILKSSGLPHKNSAKSPGTIVITGDLIKRLVEELDILDLVDKGYLNIWSSEKGGVIYSFIQNKDGMKSRKRDFGLYQFNQKMSLTRLRELSKIIKEIDKDHEEWYPWKFKLKLKKVDEYYSTSDWAQIRLKFYNTDNKYSKSCRCCEQIFEAKELLLLNLHHIITIKNGGSNNFLNLISLCTACHSLIHYDKHLLMESLFIYYSETNVIGNDKIKNALLRFDDVVTSFSQKSYLDIYDRFIGIVNRKEAKLYFFNKIMESFRYLKNKSLYQYSKYYFKPFLQPVKESENQNTDNLIFIDEPLYDLSVICIVLYSLSDRATFFSKIIAGAGNNITSLERNLQDTISEIDLYSNKLKEKITSGHISQKTLTELMLVSHNKMSFVLGTLTGKDAFVTSSTDSYLQRAVERRNNIFILSIFAACSLPLESNDGLNEDEIQTRLSFNNILSKLFSEANVKYSIDDIIKTLENK